MASPSIRDRSWVAGRLDDGATVTAIAAEAGVSRQTAHTWLVRHGLHGRPQAKSRPSASRLKTLYRRHRSVAAVADQLDVAAGTAHRWLIAAGVELSTPGSPRRPRRELDLLALHGRRAAGATLSELSIEFGVAAETVRRRLNETGETGPP